jgi:UDP-GlcNAc:undecaprenyl-phosphate GlcNAc-1-phosphate transferase
MTSVLFAFLLAVFVATSLTPAVRFLSVRLGAVDAPGGRHIHHYAMPRMGGIAVVLAFFGPFLALFMLDTQVARLFFSEPLRMLGLGLGGAVVAGLGALDDLRGVRAWKKLAVQIGAALIAFACGYRIDAMNFPGIGTMEMGIFAVPVTVLWVVAVINALNLIDGLDGLAAGVAFFACVANFVVASFGHNSLVMLISASLGGAVLGFLIYNFNPATIFMGDTGSMFLGYVLATMSLLGSAIKSSTTIAILVPLVALGLPIMDTLFAMIRRILERRPIFSPDRGHIHHRLLELGITHRRAVLILYGISIACTVGAVGLALGRSVQVGSVILGVAVMLFGMFRFANAFGFRLARSFRNPPDVSTEEQMRQEVVWALRAMQLATTPKEIQDSVNALVGKLRALGVMFEAEKNGTPRFEPRPEHTSEQRALIELVSAALPVHMARTTSATTQRDEKA